MQERSPFRIKVIQYGIKGFSIPFNQVIHKVSNVWSAVTEFHQHSWRVRVERTSTLQMSSGESSLSIFLKRSKEAYPRKIIETKASELIRQKSAFLSFQADSLHNGAPIESIWHHLTARLRHYYESKQRSCLKNINMLDFPGTWKIMHLPRFLIHTLGAPSRNH